MNPLNQKFETLKSLVNYDFGDCPEVFPDYIKITDEGLAFLFDQIEATKMTINIGRAFKELFS